MNSNDIIGTSDEVTVVSVSQGSESVKTSEEIYNELDSKTVSENFDAGFKIMGIGMAAVFGVLFILYVIIKIMGKFAKNDKKEEN